ncbi:hypothetical protein R1sor_013932 [Riccia sorocarpa]|uniref:Phytanoyl-CoA dioxygenase n=1 Tax=Riccia sorocarpa TaxID=122646 RepID=A0ABD3H8J7_9MARC
MALLSGVALPTVLSAKSFPVTFSTDSPNKGMATGGLVRSVRLLATQHRCLATSAAAAPRISEEKVKQFEEDGAAVVRGFFSSDLIEQLREAAEENMKDPGPLCDEHVESGKPGRFHDDQFLWMRSEVMKRFIFDSPAAEIARRMKITASDLVRVGSIRAHNVAPKLILSHFGYRANEVRLFYDQLFVKEPGTETTTPWHNDHSYWPLKGNQIISVWLALDYVPKSNCVQYVKGSHKWKLVHKLKSFSGDAERYKAANMTDLPPLPDIDSILDKVELLSWDLEPGDCLVHHSFAVHGAPGISSTSNRRRAYATRWVGDAVRYDPRPGTMEFLWRSKANLDPKLSTGSPMESELFPLVP